MFRLGARRAEVKCADRRVSLAVVGAEAQTVQFVFADGHALLHVGGVVGIVQRLP